MKRKLLILFFILSTGIANSQEMSLAIGTNFTRFNLRNPQTFIGTPLHSGSGSSYELAYLDTTAEKKLFYEIGIGINEYKALAGTTVNTYRWDTKSLSVRLGIEYELFYLNKFQLRPQLGMNFSTIVFGKQEINGAIFDIKNNADFSGIKLIPYLGLRAKYKVQDNTSVSVGYNYSISFKPTLTNKEYLTVKSNQIVLGLHFNIK
jgi:hypothetical protein